MECGGVNECRFGQVDDEVGCALRERPGKRALKLGIRVEVDLAAGGNDEGPVREPPARDHELETGRTPSRLPRCGGAMPSPISTDSHSPPLSKTNRSIIDRQFCPC